mmetsp:Transcript_11996/g.11552  ORF Transcript_11996/g.11552 Transcript_11996/m.11552 type:complete len:424 (+) Transcript_11996:227-1498(+)
MNSSMINYFICAFTLSFCSYGALGSEKTGSSPERHICDDEERQSFPNTCGVMDRSIQEPNDLLKEMTEWGINVGYIDNTTTFLGVDTKYKVHPVGDNGFTYEGDRTDVLPIVSQHGLFQTCFESYMKNWVKLAAETTGGYATCINIGDNAIDEIFNTVFLNMEKSVDEFARKIRANPKFSNGFNAIAFSQGNPVIRGYIIKYNDPPVKNFISVDGVIAGVSALPHCDPFNVNSTFPVDSSHATSLRSKRSLESKPHIQNDGLKKHICMLFAEIASALSYTTFMQKHVFPANYFVDRHPSMKKDFLKYSVQAKISNEGSHFNETYIANFLSVDKYVWVMGLLDKTVIPREGEHWGEVDSHDFNKILPMKETNWFTSDSFGLRTAYNEGKFTFRTHPGSHIKIPPAEYISLIEEFFLSTSTYYNQ